MGRTLFWYVFKDLLRVFMMASGALAGIMSFGGLLRPLTQQGLDASQVGKMLTYFTFPMMAYSLPVPALFAATVVYGRLSADNELTAARAGGIPLSLTGMALPAVVFGLIVAIVSLLMACFVVPIYTLKVEKVVYSNLAKLIANRIERTHEIKFGDFNVFAQKAYLPAAPGKRAGDDDSRQVVVLEGVSIAPYETVEQNGTKFRVPREFLLASTATVEIRERKDEDQVDLLIGLEGGSKFPRGQQGQHVGIGVTQFGPMEMASPIKEDTKFMKVMDLKNLYQNPEKSRRINAIVTNFVRRDQVRNYLGVVDAGFRMPGRRYTFEDPGGLVTLRLSDDATVSPDEKWAEELIVRGKDLGAVVFTREGAAPTTQLAKEARLRFRPDPDKRLMHVSIDLIGRAPVGGTRPVGNYSDTVTVPMPATVAALQSRKVSHYRTAASVASAERQRLVRELAVLSNAILAELHGRVSFAVSCLILVLVGSALGMMFRSGNFLTAFAVSFVPALLCITLIVSGQQMCHAVPWQVDRHNPVNMGLTLIWSGNVINLAIAAALHWRLHRQ